VIKITKRRVLVGCLLAAIVAGVLLKIYSVQESETKAELLWNVNEAYLFVRTNRLGYRSVPATLLLEPFAPFGLGSTDQKLSFVVFRLTQDRVERQAGENPHLGPLGVVDGKIADNQWRWEGTHFARLSEDDTSVHAIPKDRFSGIDGWSKATLNYGTSPPEGWTVSFTLSGHSASLTARGNSRVWQAIDLQRGSAPIERLWSLDERTRFVSRTEYEALFKR
jgi:hypothetical protein